MTPMTLSRPPHPSTNVPPPGAPPGAPMRPQMVMPPGLMQGILLQ